LVHLQKEPEDTEHIVADSQLYLLWMVGLAFSFIDSLQLTTGLFLWHGDKPTTKLDEDRQVISDR